MAERTMTWCRLYGDAVDDEKLRLLAFEDRWHFVALLCCKTQGLLDPSDPLMIRKAAVKLGLQPDELRHVAQRLAEVGLIEEETLQPMAWERRQFRSDTDPTNADRQRRYRERQATEKTKAAVHNGESNALHNAPVTPPRDRDRDRDRDREESLVGSGKGGMGEGVAQDHPTTDAAPPAPPPPGPPPPATQPPRDRGTRLPADWTLPPEWASWARRERPDLDLDITAACFRDHWIAKAGRDAVKCDWYATWRKWVRRETTPGQSTGPPGYGRDARQARYWADAAAGAARLATQEDPHVIDVTPSPKPLT